MELDEKVLAASRRYAATLDGRGVSPTADALAALSVFRHKLPAAGLSPGEIIDRLDRVGSPATVATNGPRFFGFDAGNGLVQRLNFTGRDAAENQTGILHGAMLRGVCHMWQDLLQKRFILNA